MSCADVYNNIKQIAEKYDLNYDKFIQQKSTLQNEHILDVIKHIERGHKCSVLNTDHLSDVIVFSYSDYYAAKWCKNSGNSYFKQGKYQESLKCYSDMASHLGDDMETNLIQFSEKYIPNEKYDSIQFLKLVSFNNTAQVYLVLKDYEKAIEKASVVLGVDSGNKKALFRRALAYRRNGQFKEAKDDLVTLNSLGTGTDPAYSDQNNKVDRELRILKKQIGKQDVKKWLLNDIGLIQYYHSFINSGFNSLDLVKNITMNDLNEMGIGKVDKMKILNGIQVLNECSCNLAHRVKNDVCGFGM
eukprot:452511_1